MFTLSAMGSSFASVHDRWLLTNRHMSSGASFSGSSQPTRSWQTAQCTKPICCLSNCYFGSTLDFPHITGSDKTLVMQLKEKHQRFYSYITIFPFIYSHFPHSVSKALPFISYSASWPPLPLSLQWMFCSVEGQEGGGAPLLGEAAAWKLIW